MQRAEERYCRLYRSEGVRRSVFAEGNNVIFSANPPAPAFTAPFTIPFPTTSAPTVHTVQIIIIRCRDHYHTRLRSQHLGYRSTLYQ